MRWTNTVCLFDWLPGLLAFLLADGGSEGFVMRCEGGMGRGFRLRMIWCYPIIDDGFGRPRRRKVDQAYELGPMRVNASFPYDYANALAQGRSYVPGQGLIPHPHPTLGRTEDTHLTAETACGQIHIDEAEFAKIRQVYQIFNSKGCGVVRLIGAKGRHFAFVYEGPLKDKYGIKCYLRYLVNRVYPGSKVTVLVDRLVDERAGVNHLLFLRQKKLVNWGREYDREDDGGSDMAYHAKYDMVV